MKLNKNIPVEQLMGLARTMGDVQYPSPLRGRSYQYPSNYPNASDIRRAILDPIGLFLLGHKLWQDGLASKDDLENQTAAFLTRITAHRWDHPTYLLTAPLVEMLAHTDRLDLPNVDTDSKPPFPAGHFVLPKHMIGNSEGDYVVMISFALLDTDDFKSNVYVRGPDNMSGRRFYVSAELSSGFGFYAKLDIDSAGIVENPDDSPFTDLDIDYTKIEPLPFVIPKIVVSDGPAMISLLANLCLSLFTFINMDDEGSIYPASMTKKVKPKRGKKGHEFWKPAMIGLSLTPTGCATGGSHASPHAHIRRGHWRRQLFGKGRQQERRLWIRPTLVNPNTKD